MNHIISSPDGSDKAAFLESLAGIGFSLVSAGRRETEDEFEKIYADAERFADKTPWQLENENIDVSNDFDQWSEIKKVRLLMVRMLMPALARCNRIAHRSKADIEALITAIATLRCFKDKGQYPESLEFLVEEGFLAEVPIDPYSGQPFVYKITENGFTLYSLGENFTDNGGARGHSTWGDSDDTGDRVFWPMQ